MHERGGVTVKPGLCFERQLSSCDIPELWSCLSHWSLSLASPDPAAAVEPPAAPAEPAQLRSLEPLSCGCTACWGPEHPYLKKNPTKTWFTLRPKRTSNWKKCRDRNCYLFSPAPWWVLPSCGWWQKAPWSSAVPEEAPTPKRLQNLSDFHAQMSPLNLSWLHRDLREYTGVYRGGIIRKRTELQCLLIPTAKIQ